MHVKRLFLIVAIGLPFERPQDLFFYLSYMLFDRFVKDNAMTGTSAFIHEITELYVWIDETDNIFTSSKTKMDTGNVAIQLEKVKVSIQG